MQGEKGVAASSIPVNRDFPDDHPRNASERIVALKVSQPAAMPSAGGGAIERGVWPVSSMEIRPFSRHGCKAAPSRTPVTSSSSSPGRAWLTGRTQSGRLAKSADPFEDRSEALSGQGDFRQLERHVLGVPRDHWQQHRTPGLVSCRTFGRPVRPTGWRSTQPTSSPSGADTPRRSRPPTSCWRWSIILRMSRRGGPISPAAQIPTHRRRELRSSTFPQGLAGMGTKRQNPL